MHPAANRSCFFADFTYPVYLTCLLAALGMLATSAPSMASDEDLPTAEEILDRYVEVTGGEASHRKLYNRVSKGTVHFVSLGQRAEITKYEAMPGKSYVRMTSQSLGTMEEGTNGEVAWEIQPSAGHRIREGTERIDALRRATFDPPTRWRELYKTAEFVGTEAVKGRPCYKVVMTPAAGNADAFYFDSESGLLVKSEYTLQHPMGPLALEDYTSEYKKVDGILYAHQSRVIVAGQEMLISMTKVAHNVDVPDDSFALPDEIKTLAKATTDSTARGANARSSKNPSPPVADRSRRVENGLVPLPRKRGYLLLQGTKRPEKTESILNRMEYHHVPGASIAVINNYKLEWTQAYGVRQAGEESPVTSETLFQAASVGKTVAATAALRLVEEHKLGLHEDINGKLKSWKIPANQYTTGTPISLHMLLSHMSGVSGFGGYGYAANEVCPTLRQVLDGQPPSRLEPIRVVAAPGSKYRYSSGGYTIVQQVICDLTGKPFQAAVSDLVLDPLRMRHSTFEQPPGTVFRPSMAAEHDFDGAPLPNGPLCYPQAAAGGLWSTPADLATFAIALMDARRGEPNGILSSTMVSQMLQPVALGVGLGVQVRSAGDTLHFFHVGGSVGSCCIMVAYPEVGKGAVVMTNSASGDTLCLEILTSIFNEYEWGLLMVSFG